MAVQILVLVTSVTNLVLAVVIVCLLRSGYAQTMPLRVMVLQPGGEPLQAGISAHLTVSIGKGGVLHHFNGKGEAVTLLRLPELERCQGDLADVYIVPRSHV